MDKSLVSAVGRGYSALPPAARLAPGYNDYKAIEACERIGAIGDGRPAQPDFDFGWRVQQAVEACQRSHEAGRWVRVGEQAAEGQ